MCHKQGILHHRQNLTVLQARINHTIRVENPDQEVHLIVHLHRRPHRKKVQLRAEVVITHRLQMVVKKKDNNARCRTTQMLLPRQVVAPWMQSVVIHTHQINLKLAERLSVQLGQIRTMMLCPFHCQRPR